MKLKLSPRKKASIMAFLSMSWEIICFVVPALFVCALFLTPPVLSFLYLTKVPKVLAIIAGLVLSCFLFYFGKKIRNAIKDRKFKALLVWMSDMIITANYSIIILVFILAGIGLLSEESRRNIPKVTWQSIILFYYGVVVPGAICFGIFMSFGYEGFEEILEKQDNFFHGIGTEEELEFWKREKFRLKYYNPILLPFSCVFFLTRFLLKFVGVILSGFKKTYQQRYQEKLKDI